MCWQEQSGLIGLRGTPEFCKVWLVGVSFVAILLWRVKVNPGFNVSASLIGIFLTLICSHAHAGVLSGQDLLEICEPAHVDPVYRLKISQCSGYIIGVSDTFDCKNMTLGFNWDSEKYRSQPDLIRSVIEWLHFHPNVLHYQASGLVASALAKKYPCSNDIAHE